MWREIFSSPYLGLKAFYDDLQQISREYLNSSEPQAEGSTAEGNLLLSKFIAKHNTKKDTKRQRREDTEPHSTSSISSEKRHFFDTHPVYSYVFPQNEDFSNNEEEDSIAIAFPDNRVINAFLTPETYDKEDIENLTKRPRGQSRWRGEKEEERDGEKQARSITNIPFLLSNGHRKFSLEEVTQICDFCAYLFSFPRIFSVEESSEGMFTVSQQNELHEIVAVLTKQKTNTKDQLSLTLHHFFEDTQSQKEEESNLSFASSRLSDALQKIKTNNEPKT